VPKLVLLPEAREGLEQICDYYHSINPALEERFLAALQSALDRIAVFPHAHAIRLGDFRAATMSTFPYNIFYRIVEEEIYVYAVYHHARDTHGFHTTFE